MFEILRKRILATAIAILHIDTQLSSLTDPEDGREVIAVRCSIQDECDHATSDCESCACEGEAVRNPEQLLIVFVDIVVVPQSNVDEPLWCKGRRVIGSAVRRSVLFKKYITVMTHTGSTAPQAS